MAHQVISRYFWEHLCAKTYQVVKLIKECEIVLIAQEGERAMATLNMVTGAKNWQVPVTEDGGIVFSTKHTAVDEDRNGKKSTFSV